MTDDGLRLWIEIFVTHKCGEEKIQYIKENGYNCIEVKIPEGIETKEDLSEFLVNSDDSNLNPNKMINSFLKELNSHVIPILPHIITFSFL